MRLVELVSSEFQFPAQVVRREPSTTRYCGDSGENYIFPPRVSGFLELRKAVGLFGDQSLAETTGSARF